jgi:hypothetical protein
VVALGDIQGIIDIFPERVLSIVGLFGNYDAERSLFGGYKKTLFDEQGLSLFEQIITAAL